MKRSQIAAVGSFVVLAVGLVIAGMFSQSDIAADDRDSWLLSLLAVGPFVVAAAVLLGVRLLLEQMEDRGH